MPPEDNSLIPESTVEGGQDTTPSGQDTTPSGQDTTPSGDDTVPAGDFDPSFVPEGFPDKFIKDGKPDWHGVAKSYTELEKKYSESDRQSAPEAYQLNEEIPRDIIPEDDPLLEEIFKVGKENNVSQKQMDALVSKFVGFVQDSTSVNKEEELKALGNNPEEIISRNQDFYVAKLDKEDYAAFRRLSTTAEAVKLFDKMRGMMVDQKGVIPSDPGNISSKLTESELRAKMQLDAYHDPRHPDYTRLRKEVDEGFKALYPDKPA